MRPWLEPGEHTVGTHVNVSHVAATPVGMKVTSTAELVAVEGRKLSFRVSCRDEVDLIGEGTHERAVIYPEKFMARLAAKGRVA
jgi:fluoroacetyl-CoA thioesterase